LTPWVSADLVAEGHHDCRTIQRVGSRPQEIIARELDGNGPVARVGAKCVDSSHSLELTAAEGDLLKRCGHQAGGLDARDRREPRVHGKRREQKQGFHRLELGTQTVWLSHECSSSTEVGPEITSPKIGCVNDSRPEGRWLREPVTPMRTSERQAR